MASRRTLTAKQEAFVSAMLDCGNASEAVRRAGYATKSPDNMGSELLGNPRVAEKLDELRKAIERKVVITKSHVIDKLQGILDADKTKNRDRIAAARELNRMMGYHAPRQLQHTGADGGPIAVKGLSGETVEHVKLNFLGITDEDRIH